MANLLTNPGFETNAANWAADSATITRVTTPVHAGAGAGQIKATATSGVELDSDRIAVTPGQTITVSAWVRTAVTAQYCVLSVNFFTDADSGGYVSTSEIDQKNDSTAWQQYTGMVVVPAGAGGASLVLAVTSSAVNEIHYIDDAFLGVPSTGVALAGTAAVRVTASGTLTVPTSSIRAGSATIAKMYVGATEVVAAYIGASKIFGGTSTPPPSGGAMDLTRVPIGMNWSAAYISDTYLDWIIAKNVRGPICLWYTDTHARDVLSAAGIPVVFYMDLTSTRATNDVGAAAYEPSQVVENAFLHRSGSHYDESGWPGQTWMNCGGLNGTTPRTEWRDAWETEAVSRVAGSAWSGVWADNDMPLNSDYYALVPNDEGITLAKNATGTLDMLTVTKAALAADKYIIPNIGEPQNTPGHWQEHSSAAGGGWIEMFTGWAPDASASYYGTADIYQQMLLCGETGVDGKGIGVFRCPANARKRALFGYGVFLVGGGGDYGAYYCNPDAVIDPSGWWQPEMDMLIGATSGAIANPKTNCYTRTLTNGWAACNIADEGGASQTLTVPSGLKLPSGSTAPATVTLAPHNSVVYKAS